DGAGIPATSAACVTPGSRSEEQAGPRGDEDGGVAQRQSRGLISPWSEVRVLPPPPPPEPERPHKTRPFRASSTWRRTGRFLSVIGASSSSEPSSWPARFGVPLIQHAL